jgi:hypothetical protein
MISDRRPTSHSASDSGALTAVVERRSPLTVRMPAGYYDPDASSFDEPRLDDFDELLASATRRERDATPGAAGSF